MPKDKLVMLNFNPGIQIRNAFGLNGGNTTLLGPQHADDVSMMIIEKLWTRLQG
jgi:hypothetical protein